MVDGSYESWCLGDNERLMTFFSNTYHIITGAQYVCASKTKFGFWAFWRVKLNLPRMEPFLPNNIGYPWGFWFYEIFLQHWGTWSNSASKVFSRTGAEPPGGQIWNQLMGQIKPSLELYHWSKDEPHSFNHLDFTGFWKNPKNGPKMVRKRFFGIISGTKSPRTKIFALLGSSYMTGPWGNHISTFLEIHTGSICWRRKT